MNTKLTLTIEQSVIEMAKKYAKDQGRSLSDIVENYFKALTVNKIEKKVDEIELDPMIESMRGSFKAPKNFDYKKELQKALSKKHLG
ncbi:MAG: DUF6364 family protein [Flavobacteriia bacterium]|jgi:predicted HicB family RNase H-like nuclease